MDSGQDNHKNRIIKHGMLTGNTPHPYSVKSVVYCKYNCSYQLKSSDMNADGTLPKCPKCGRDTKWVLY